MKAFLLCALGLAAFATATPSVYELDQVFRRALNDECNAPLGKGTCQPTSECPGISYPTKLCPNDPSDVQVSVLRQCIFQVLADFFQQCCVKIPCKVPEVPLVKSGFCRSVKDNGCPGGTFYSNLCPGSSDIKCCVSSPSNPPVISSPPVPVTPPPPVVPLNPCTPAATDKLLFEDDLPTFLAAKSAKNPPCFIWDDDRCSCSPDHPGAYDFVPSCARHDFGYRNSKAQNRFGELKDRIDSNFQKDLYNECDRFNSLQNLDCHWTADIYVGFVETFGKTKRDDMGRSLEIRDCL